VKSKYGIDSRWKLTPPFQVPSTAFLQPSWSLFQHIPSQQSCYIYIHNIIYIHRPFSQGPFTSHIHISEFATILGQYSYFYRLGETGCYNSLPLKGTPSSVFFLKHLSCLSHSATSEGLTFILGPVLFQDLSLRYLPSIILGQQAH
jgi:hypothetical protein